MLHPILIDISLQLPLRFLAFLGHGSVLYRMGRSELFGGEVAGHGGFYAVMDCRRGGFSAREVTWRSG